MRKVTWRRFDQSTKQLVVGQTTMQVDNCSQPTNISMSVKWFFTIGPTFTLVALIRNPVMDERKDEDRPMVSISGSTFIQCFDTNSGWVAGRTSNPKKLVCHLLALSAQYVGSIYASLGRLSKVCCCSPCWQEILIDCCSSGGQMRVVPHCQHT